MPRCLKSFGANPMPTGFVFAGSYHNIQGGVLAALLQVNFVALVYYRPSLLQT